MMKLKPSPLARAGERNLRCPCYHDCLDHAVELHWKYWDCSECSYRFLKKPRGVVLSTPDADPYYRVPSKIYREVTYMLG